MGQYHYTVNLDKREFIHPHKLGDGLKLVEQCGHAPGGTNDALHLLLACSSGRGGGDFESDNFNKATGEGFVGRWAGDRIAVVGDYAEDDDLPAEFKASTIYSRCADPEYAEEDDEQAQGLPAFRDITPDLIPVLEREYELIYVGSGWRDRVSPWKCVEGFNSTYGGEDGDRIAEIRGKQFKMSGVRNALRKAWNPQKHGRRDGAKVTLAELVEAGLKAVRP